MKISKAGAVVLAADAEFECTTTLENPFKRDSAYYAETHRYVTLPNGATYIQKQPAPPGMRLSTREEKDEWIRAREIFIAEALLREVGWNTFVERCKNEEIEDIIKFHTPCEGPTKQCQFDCPIFGNCSKTEI